MQTFETRFEARARELIEARVSEIQDIISAGNAEDFAAYKRDAGRIAGLREAMDLFDDANKDLKEH